MNGWSVIGVKLHFSLVRKQRSSSIMPRSQRS